MSGTQKNDPEEVFAAATDVLDEQPNIDLPLTAFEGWLKQLDPQKLDVMRGEAVDAAFPLFLTWSHLKVTFFQTLHQVRGNCRRSTHS